MKNFDEIEADTETALQDAIDRANDPNAVLTCAEEKLLIDAGLARYDAVGMVWL